MRLNKFSILTLTFCFLAAFQSSAANEAKWAKLSLQHDTVFKEIYSQSIAESIFFTLRRQKFLPPIQYLTRPVASKLEDDTKAISKEVLTSLGVDTQKRSTIRLTQKPFKGGVKQNLKGMVSEFQSTNGSETSITCIAVVQEDQKLHVAYVQAYQASLPTCAAQLVELTRTEVFTK